MKQTSNLVRVAACIGVLAGVVAFAQVAQAAEGKAVVRTVKGSADYQEAGAWRPLKSGQELKAGTVVRTANSSSVTLFLDQNGPMVQLVENTTLAIEKLKFEATGVDTVIETSLDLKSGRIIGVVKKLSSTSKYEIKTPSGVAGIRGTEYSISADGMVNVIEGQIVVVFVKADGGVVTQVVDAGNRFNPATQRTEPIPSDLLSAYRAEIDAMKGVAPVPVDVEPPPVVRISPVVGGN